jgi:hypothetical protein
LKAKLKAGPPMVGPALRAELRGRSLRSDHDAAVAKSSSRETGSDAKRYWSLTTLLTKKGWAQPFGMNSCAYRQPCNGHWSAR